MATLLILDSTTKSIKAVMSGPAATNNPEFTVAFADSTATTFTQGAADGAFNGTSVITLVAAPAASTQRVVKSITIENQDTAPVTITIDYDNNGTARTLFVVTLQVGDTWTTDGTFDTNGSLKTVAAPVNLANAVGVLETSNGGTGQASYSAGDIVYYASGTSLSKLSLGTQGQILRAGSSAPEWAAVDGGIFT